MTGKIIKGVGGLYVVSTKEKLYECSVRGIFRKMNIVPTVGDDVDIEVIDNKNLKGNIIEIQNRKNSFIRPRVVNVDQTVIVISIKNPSINYDLLDRIIVLAEEQNTEIIICINKVELGNEEECELIKDLYENIGYEVVLTSTKEDIGIDRLKKLLNGKTSVFSGLSGVGKSSLTNKIISQNKMETGNLSEKIGRGKHTTRHCELIEIDENSFIVDAPGFSSLSLEHIDIENLSEFFKEFKKFEGECRFSDCIHVNEPDCGVKKQVGKGINEARYNRYLSFLKAINNK